MELVALVRDLRSCEFIVVRVLGIPNPKQSVRENPRRMGRQHLHHARELRSAKVGIDHTLHVVRVQIMIGIAGLGRTQHPNGDLGIFAGTEGESSGPGIECHGGWVNLLLCGGSAWVLGDPVAEGAYNLSVSNKMIYMQRECEGSLTLWCVVELHVN